LLADHSGLERKSPVVLGVHPHESTPYRKKKRPLRGIGVAVGADPIRPNVASLTWQEDQVESESQTELTNICQKMTREY
jgi:hypothetical protein